MIFFSEDNEYINAECESCGRVLKIAREKCTALTQGEFNVLPAIQCQCGVASDHITSAKKAVSSEPVAFAPTQNLSIEQRRGILQQEIGKYIKKGFRVVSQTDTTAQLVKPKIFSCFWALVFTITLIGLIFYLIWYWSKRDQQIYIEVDVNGRIKTIKTRK